MKQHRKTATAGALAMVAALVGLGWASPSLRQVKVDSDLLPYKVAEGVSGNISSIGSDTLNNLMTYWAESFKKFYPNVNIQIEGKGTATAFPALAAGTAQLGPASRPAKPSEEDAFESKWGYKPTQIRTSVDALAVFVNKDNPIKSLSLTQVDAVFSKARRRGGSKEIKTWGQLGLTGEWADKPIALYGRNSASGTYAFFKEHSMKNGDYKDEVKEQPGSASVVLAVATDRYAIGYSGIGYATSSVRAVPLSEKDGESPLAASAENAYAGTYPLARFLFVYINKPPSKPMDPLTREFVKLICSKDGQEVVVKDGYFPIPAVVAREELKKVQ
ncbi:MAG TPA: phosphate ABC transporter substrate-binding protein [Planctomycetota bacterium]|nr:phosphate ABC transporter substrate-binding protein [Planctomycetota bacterium]